MAPAARADFGIESFSAHTTDSAEVPYTLAGGHPFQSLIGFSIPTASGANTPVENLKDIYFSPPRGFIGNPAAVSRCSVSRMLNEECPPDSRVGFVEVTRTASLRTYSLYNLVPESGYPAQFGFLVELGHPLLLSILSRPRTDSYGLTFARPNLPTGAEVSGFVAGLCGFGVEGDGIMTPIRCASPSESAGVPFLSNPVDCSDHNPIWEIAIDSWESAGTWLPTGDPDLSNANWKTATAASSPVTGCDDLGLLALWDPSLAITPLQPGGDAVQADQPTGLRIGFDFPQSNDPTDPNTEFDPEASQAPAPKQITVRMSAGLAISPATASGLGACSDQASDPAGDQVHYDTVKPVTCPDASKIGSAMATSPLLAARNPTTDEVIGAEPIPGSVYVLKPHPDDLASGQDGKFRLLIVLENSKAGINIKIPGIATTDKDAGQITTVFTRSPQLPASHLTLDLKQGPRAPLMTPVTCGKFGTTSDLVPWSAPGTPDAHPTAGFEVATGPGGSPCVDTPGRRPFAPTLPAAGTDSAKAGAPSPFSLELNRPDGDQELSSLSFTAPLGFTAKLKGVATCSDAAIAVAQSKSGGQEQADPSCPAASLLGTVTTGAGPGPNPYYAYGSAYLAGPYKGAPLSFAFITPALAGPFDLGNIVFRAAAYIDPSTAQVTIKTDELPQILAGIPLRLRSIAIRLDRADFALNPTDCEPMSVPAVIKSSNGATANPTAFFQVGGCNDLRFKPRLGLQFLDNLARNGHPAVRAILRSGPGEAGLAATAIILPEGELLDLRQLGTLCARGLPPERCPRSSRIGAAHIRSPLLDEPLTGPIYLRRPSGRLPALIADLHGGGLHLLLHGQTSAPAGRLRIRFGALPDAPFDKALITLAGGSRGIFVNSQSLCAQPRRAAVSLSAHDGAERRLSPVIRLPGGC